jgi:hypothetical protein
MTHAKSFLITLLLASLALLPGLGQWMAHTSPAQAAADGPSATTLYVNGTAGDNDNDCLSPSTACATIAAAVGKAGSGDTIQIAAGTYVESNITTSEPLTLNGAGADITIVDGNQQGRIFTLNNNATLTQMTLRNGQTPPEPNIFNSGGGAIRVGTGAQVLLQNMVIEGNATSGSAGPGGAIFTTGNLTIDQSVIRNNTTQSSGGAIFQYSTVAAVVTVTHSLIEGNQSVQGTGGGIYASRGLVVVNSVIRENQAPTREGGGITFQSFSDNGTMRVDGSTIEGNRAVVGAGISAAGSTVEIVNTTVSGNVASSYSGGVQVSGEQTTLSLRNSTVVDNRRTSTVGPRANGLYVSSDAAANLSNVILFGNDGDNCGVGQGTITSLGHNLSGDNTCFLGEASDLPNTDPRLMPLSDYGGPTPTHALRPNSPAIDAGDNVNCPATDQRGAARPFDGDGDGTASCDMGAVEAQHQLTIVESVSFAEGSGGSNTAIFTVTLSPAHSQVVTVDYATEDGPSENGATAPQDYAETSGTLTFQPGETVKTISVSVVTDSDVEPDEIFYVNLFNATNVEILSGRSVAAILNDDSLPNLNINDAGVQETDTGTINAVFAVNLSLPSNEVVTVDYTTVDGTGENAATAPADYRSISGTLTFQPGETGKQITVQVAGDMIDEGESEHFFVDLLNPVNADLGKGRGTGTIEDNDVSRLRLRPGPQVAAGNVAGALAPFTVDLSLPTSFVVTVDYATRDGIGDDGATAPDDYTATSGTLTFQPGETEQTFSVPVIGKPAADEEKTFRVDLANANGVPIQVTTTFATIRYAVEGEESKINGIFLPLVMR